MTKDNGQDIGQAGDVQQDASSAKKAPKMLNFGEIAEIEATRFNIDQARNLFLGNIQKQNDQMIRQNAEMIRQNSEVIKLLRLATTTELPNPPAVVAPYPVVDPAPESE